jgi:DNA-binding transcriptional LysR family regulator
MRFDLVDLRLFLHVADTASITHGAERAHLALASASARIRGMEETLGVALLKRGRRGVVLTPAGQCLLDHARIVTQQIEAMRGDLGAFARGLGGSVHVLSNTAAFSEHLPRALASFLKANPTISVDLEERESASIAEAIAAGVADIGIVTDVVVAESVRAHPFREDRLVLVVPKNDELAARRRVHLHEVIDRSFVGLPRQSALQRHLAGHAARLGKSMRVRVGVGGFDEVCRMVETGVGIAIIPEAAARRCRRSMGIAIVALAEAWARRRLMICVRAPGRLPAPAARLFQHLMQSAGAGS